MHGSDNKNKNKGKAYKQKHKKQVLEKSLITNALVSNTDYDPDYDYDHDHDHDHDHGFGVGYRRSDSESSYLEEDGITIDLATGEEQSSGFIGPNINNNVSSFINYDELFSKLFPDSPPKLYPMLYPMLYPSSNIADSEADLEANTCDIPIFKKGFFEYESITDYLSCLSYESLFWIGLICSSLKQYEPALGFWLEHGDSVPVLKNYLDISTDNLNASYWFGVFISFPCAFAQAGLAIQGKKPYANKNKTIHLISEDPDLVKIYGGLDNKKNRGLFESGVRGFLVNTMALTGVISQTYWIGAQFWVLPYFERDLGFKRDMENYFYYYNTLNFFDPNFIFTLFITLGGAKGYWAQLVYYSDLLIDQAISCGKKNSYDDRELTKKKFFASFISDIKKNGSKFFHDTNHPLKKDLPKDVYLSDKHFEEQHLRLFFNLLYSPIGPKRINRDSKYRFKVIDVESSVLSGWWRKSVLYNYKKYNFSFANHMWFKALIFYPLAIIGLWQNAFAFMTIFQNIPGFKNYLSDKRNLRVFFDVLSYGLGVVSFLNHVEFNLEAFYDLSRVKASKVKLSASPLIDMENINMHTGVGRMLGYDQTRSNIDNFNDCNNRFMFGIQSALNLWLILVVSLASIFTALVSTRDNPFPEDNKTLSNIWFGFSLFVVASQISTQITTKGEKSMKFIKYLSRKLAVNKSDESFESRELVITSLVDYLQKLNELYDKDYLFEIGDYKDASLKDIETEILLFYKNKNLDINHGDLRSSNSNDLSGVKVFVGSNIFESDYDGL